MTPRIGSVAAAQYLGTTTRELKALRKAKRIPFYRIGHRTVSYAVSDLDEFLERCRVPAKEHLPCRPLLVA